jgi:hypothetical protein
MTERDCGSSALESHLSIWGDVAFGAAMDRSGTPIQWEEQLAGVELRQALWRPALAVQMVLVWRRRSGAISSHFGREGTGSFGRHALKSRLSARQARWLLPTHLRHRRATEIFPKAVIWPRRLPGASRPSWPSKVLSDTSESGRWIGAQPSCFWHISLDRSTTSIMEASR